MVELSFSLEGQEVVHRTLGITAEGVTTFQEPLSNIGANFMKVFDANFRSRGALYGGWQPRKAKYRAGRRIDTWPLMERTGRMRRSFRSKASSTSLVLDNTAPYFVYHQSSAPRRSRLPRRAMMKIRQQEATMIVKAFQAYLVALTRRGGR